MGDNYLLDEKKFWKSMERNNYPSWLVSVEQAKKLKEIGFDAPTMFYLIDASGQILLNPDNGGVDLCGVYSLELKDISLSDYNDESFNVRWTTSIPMWEQVFEWFREKGLESYIRLESHALFDEGNYYYFEITKSNLRQIDWQGDFDDYNEAREELLNNLIEKYVKRKK